MVNGVNLKNYFTADEIKQIEEAIFETLKRNPGGACRAQIDHDLLFVATLDHGAHRLGYVVAEMERIGSIVRVRHSMAVSDQAFSLLPQGEEKRIDINAYEKAVKDHSKYCYPRGRVS